jgi:YHS domain-containing protein
MKMLFTFLATFVLGAVVALAIRTARHDPHAAPAADPHAAPTHAAPATSAPAASPPGATAAPAAPAPASAHHAAVPPPAPVNTLCAICGMKVDPSLPTATYQGKTIAFGCRMCPPKFKADPDKYGPLYLRNEVITR